MITAHNYRDIPCDNTDCSYIGYSHKNLTYHKIRFHGHGKKPTEFAHHTCPYSTCKVSFQFQTMLQRHLDVHENRVLSCNYCQFRNVVSVHMHKHLMDHFKIKNFICDICSSKFSTKHMFARHLRNVHGTDDFECVDCKFTTEKLGLFQQHRKSCKERLKHSRIL